MPESQTDLSWQSVLDDHLRNAQNRAAAGNNPHVPSVDMPTSTVKVYQTLNITEVSLEGRDSVELNKPIDLLEGDASRQLAAGPAIGVILHHEQAWRMKAVTIGRLMHSLCLAPGEVTQVAMTDWQRATSGSSTEDVNAQENASQTAQRNRFTQDIIDSVASSVQQGGSTASSSSSQASSGAGGVLGFIGVSGGASTNSGIARSANWSTGTRNATLDSQQRIRELTEQHAANARSKRATLVQEVSEQETESFSTRVVANYNHMHSLNMQYYEVLQVFELATRPVRAERCIFLPMQVAEIDVSVIRDFSLALANAASALGLPVLAAAIRLFELTPEQTTDEIDKLRILQQRAESELSDAHENLSTTKRQLAEQLQVLEDRSGQFSMVLEAKSQAEQRERAAFSSLGRVDAKLAEAKHNLEGAEARLAAADKTFTEAKDDLQKANARKEKLSNEIVRFAKTLGITVSPEVLQKEYDTLRKLLPVKYTDDFTNAIKAQAAAEHAHTEADKALDAAKSSVSLKEREWETAQASRAMTDKAYMHAQAEVHRLMQALSVAQKNRVQAEEGLAHLGNLERSAHVTLSSRRNELNAARDNLNEALEAQQGFLADEKEFFLELNAHRFALNQALWGQLDPAVCETMLKRRSHQGTSLLETVDPQPIAIIGNYVGFRWNFPDDEQGAAGEAAFIKRYVDDHREPALDTHVLPTGGVFSEAVLGRANAAEKLDLTRSWNWDETTIPLQPTAIKKLKAAQREARAEAIPGQLGPSAVSINPLPAAPAGPGHEMANIIGANLFRDMSGSSVIGGLLQAGQKAAAEGSEHAQQQAHENISAYLDHIEELLPQVTDAISEGKIDPSSLGALKNSLVGGKGIDAEELLGAASEAGLFL